MKLQEERKPLKIDPSWFQTNEEQPNLETKHEEKLPSSELTEKPLESVQNVNIRPQCIETLPATNAEEVKKPEKIQQLEDWLDTIL